MLLKDILINSKHLCRIDQEETEFDPVLTIFVNDTISDLIRESQITTTIKVPVIQGEAVIEEGYQILSITPTLNIGDRIIGKTIFTTHEGILDVLVSEEAPVLVKDTDAVNMQDYLLNLIPYSVAALWYGYKKKTDLSMFWQQRYELEKYKRLDSVKAEETYEIGLPFADFF